jgi:hypothetical protein
MSIRISKDGANFDLGTGFALLSSIGAMILPLFIVIDALSGKLTWVLPSLLLGCALGAVLSAVLTSRPFSAAATFTAGLFVGAVFLSVAFLLAIFHVGVVGTKITLSSVVGLSLGAAALLLVIALRLTHFAKRRGERV